MLERINLEEIDEAALEALIEAGMPESVTMEYKRDTYGRNDEAKRELLKDVSSFANAQGGHLVIGIAEKDGVADAVMPFTGDADAEALRLEDIVRAGLEPPLLGLRVRPVPVSGGHVVVLRVPRSWNPPHRLRQTRRVFGRTSARAHELGMEELRALFTQRLTAEERAARFVEERRARIEAGGANLARAGVGGRLVVHIVPLGHRTGPAIDPVAARSRPERFQPLGSGGGFGWRLNLQGLCVYGGRWPALRYTQLFRSGAVEAVFAPVVGEVEGQRLLAGDVVAEALVKGVPRFLASLLELDVASPMLVAVALEGVRGAQMQRGHPAFMDDEHACDEDVLPLPDFVLERRLGRDEVVVELSKTLDVLWNAFGHERCNLFSEDRQWQGRR